MTFKKVFTLGLAIPLFIGLGSTVFASGDGAVLADPGAMQGKDFDSVDPSLQRQAILNMAYGLYEVVRGKI